MKVDGGRARPEVSGLIVRRVVPDDWAAFRGLRLAALADSPLAFVEQYDHAVSQPDQYWRERVGRATGGSTVTTVLAELGRGLVGMASCFVEPEVTDRVSAHVVGVFVVPGARGQGVAEALMTAVVGWARDEAAAERVRLFVTDVNPRAEAFYTRIGFCRTGETMPYPPDPTITEHELEYHGPE